jgi:hypothetical protein
MIEESLLRSWNEGPAKQSIVEFVLAVTANGGPQFVKPDDRIAVFDNDGTLWSEQPLYFQLAFVLDRLKALAPQHPEWKDKQPFKAALEGDFETVVAGGEAAVRHASVGGRRQFEIGTLEFRMSGAGEPIQHNLCELVRRCCRSPARAEPRTPVPQRYA